MMRGMSSLPMKTRVLGQLAWLACSLFVLAAPVLSVLAADEEKPPDARLEGFTRGVKVEGGTLGTWFLFVILAVLAASTPHCLLAAPR